MTTKKIGFLILLLFIPISSFAATVCTDYTRIEELYPRDSGWIHVRMQNVANGDISNCGNGGALGLLLNFNDTTGTNEGKKMLLDILRDAKKSGDRLILCSTGCDTQHATYSRLSYINNY